MFSSRLHGGFEPNRLTGLLARKGDAVIDLTISNPTAAGIEYDRDVVLRALADERCLIYEPSPRGLPEAREAVAGYYADAGIAVDPDRVILTASTSEAYSWLFKLLCDPGDEVLVPRPSYPLFEFLAHLESVRVNQYRLFYDEGWHLDTHDLASRLTPRTRAIVYVNPNNPTGSYLKRGELDDVAELCARHGVALISDEVFLDYAFGPDPERAGSVAGETRCRVFALSGLSKVAALPQLKLGWIVGNDGAALSRLEWIADTYLSVGAPVQLATPALLASRHRVQAQIRERTRRNLDELRSLARVLRVEGGWYATVQVPRVRSEEEWALALLDRFNILVQPGYFFDFESEAFLILSLLKKPGTDGTFPDFARAIQSLE